jgi:flagellar hook-associated protein 2
MGDFFGISQAGNSNLDLLVQAYRDTQKPKLDQLSSKKTDLERRRSFFNTLNTRLNALVSQLDKFTAENSSDDFVTRAANTSDSSYLTATVISEADVGLNSVKINQIATKDILISNQLSLDGNFNQNTFTFTLSSGENSTEITVQLDGDETNEEAMRKIVSAVNENEDVKVQAAFVKDTNSTGRLSFTADDTGSENNVTISGGNELNSLGLKANLSANENNRKIADDTNAGYKTTNINDLDSEIVVNGITVKRSSNSLDDVLEGVTLNLLKPQEETDSELIVDTAIDVKAVEELIKPLLTEFNNTLKFLNANKTQQRSDVAIGSLQSRLRGIVSDSVSSVAENAPNYLLEIGVTVNDDGTLALTDTEKLKDYLSDDPQKVADLFTSSDSFVAKIESAISTLHGDDGLIRSRTLSISDQIDYTEERTSQLQSRIDQQAAALREQYTSYLENMFEAEQQLNYLFTLPSGGGNAFDGLVSAGF